MNFDYVISLDATDTKLEVGVSYDRTVTVYVDLRSAMSQCCIFNNFYQIRVAIPTDVCNKSDITKVSKFKVTKRFEPYEITNTLDNYYQPIPELTDSLQLGLYRDYVDLLKSNIRYLLSLHKINISQDEISNLLMISNDDYYRWIELLRILKLFSNDASPDYVRDKLIDFVIQNHEDNIKSIKRTTDLYAIKLIQDEV